MLFPQFYLVPSSCVLGSYSSSGTLCSMGCLWLLAVTGSCGCWVPNGSSSYLSFFWFPLVAQMPVVSWFLVPCSSSGSSSYLWLLVVPWVSSSNLWFLKLSMLPVAYGSSGCLWFLVVPLVPQVPRVTCGSLLAFLFLRLLGFLWFLGITAVPMVPQVPWIAFGSLVSYGSSCYLWFLRFPVVPVVPWVDSVPQISYDSLWFLRFPVVPVVPWVDSGPSDFL